VFHGARPVECDDRRDIGPDRSELDASLFIAINAHRDAVPVRVVGIGANFGYPGE